MVCMSGKQPRTEEPELVHSDLGMEGALMCPPRRRAEKTVLSNNKGMMDALQWS